jgi:glucose/arabinose dehydrogenase
VADEACTLERGASVTIQKTAGLLVILISSTVHAGQAIRAVRAASGFSSPVYLTYSPGDFDRLFIVQQNGQIRIRTGGVTLGTPFLNIGAGGSNLIVSGGEQGLLGLAFHPNYQSNGTFYVYYTASGGGANTLARYSVSGNPDVASPVGTVLFSVPDPFSNHNGGWIAFGPDGYLYIAMGDGGSGNDPNNAGQNLDTMMGKIHRIDVDGADGIPGNDDDDGIIGNGIAGYSSPPDNPFFGATPGIDSIWAYGLRNPWRNSFDRLGGDLYIADVGQGAWEEINFQAGGAAGGANYGWRCMEGNSCTGLSGCTCNSPALTDPIHVYSHGVSHCSVTGGYVYRGCSIPDLQGAYFFADFCSDTIWTFRYVGGSVTELTNRTAELVPDVGTITSISSFGEDAYGELYILDHAGEVFKILPDAAPADCNGNSVGDACDILDGTSTDVNSNGIPDECEVPPPAQPLADPTGINKSRSVSLAIPAPAVAAGGELTATRVTLTSLHHPDPPYAGGAAADFSAYEGQHRWVGPPTSFIESTSVPTPFMAAVLQCQPYYHDWSTVGLLHVFGHEIVPSSVYTVASVDDFCAGNEDNCIVISPGLEVATTRWADIETPYNPPSPSVQPDLADVSALVNKFRSQSGAPIKARAAIIGETPNLTVDIGFDQISACVDAFRGAPYPHAGPTPCP